MVYVGGRELVEIVIWGEEGLAENVRIQSLWGIWSKIAQKTVV